jgi:hydrogenase expression/formation protein HypE
MSERKGRRTPRPDLVFSPPGIAGDIRDEQIVAGHGAGGRKTHRLIRNVFVREFGGRALTRLEDGAVLPRWRGDTVMTTDSYVVQPLFFPGGDIGKLAVCGTVNDLAVMGAEPRYLSVGFVLREGLSAEVLARVCRSIGIACRGAGVEVVTGDTKVIERGEDEGLYVNTTGIGTRPAGVRLGVEHIRPGDAVILSGAIGEHEAAIAVARGAWRFKGKVTSDCAALHGLIRGLGRGIRVMRDPTRGGLATVLNEFAEGAKLGIVIDADSVPVPAPVRGVARLLGLDPFYMANEGKVVLVSEPGRTSHILAAMRRHPLGRGAVRIGSVVKSPKGVWLKTGVGSRPLIMLEGEQLPRIC